MGVPTPQCLTKKTQPGTCTCTRWSEERGGRAERWEARFSCRMSLSPLPSLWRLPATRPIRSPLLATRPSLLLPPSPRPLAQHRDQQRPPPPPLLRLCLRLEAGEQTVPKHHHHHRPPHRGRHVPPRLAKSLVQLLKALRRPRHQPHPLGGGTYGNGPRRLRKTSTSAAPLPLPRVDPSWWLSRGLSG